MKPSLLTDEQVEQEIARLLTSDYVKLAKQEQRVKNRRRQYLYSLRCMEKRGKELAAQGIDIDALEEMYAYNGEEVETDEES